MSTEGDGRRRFLRTLALVHAGALAGCRWPGVASGAAAGEASVLGSLVATGLVIDGLERARDALEDEASRAWASLDLSERQPGNLAPFALLAAPERREELIALGQQAVVERSEGYAERVALAAGCLLLQAGDRHLAPELRRVVADSGLSPVHASLELDAWALRRELGAAALSEADLEALLRVLMPRLLTRYHTLKPDASDGDEWVVTVTRWRRAHRQRMTELARAVTAPNAALAAQLEAPAVAGARERALEAGVARIREALSSAPPSKG